jgi:Tocopherol cyclase
MACFSGVLTVDGKQVEIADWVGSQNHNWGSRHTDLYAWGQVAGFDNQPDSFLEVATASLRLGPFWTPPITPVVLRHRQREYAFTRLGQAIRAKGRFGYFSWEFASSNEDAEIAATISAPREAFVGLRYYNPPGGIKHCLNSKIASCTLRLTDRRAGTSEVLETRNRAAFEILTDDREHGVDISA